MSRNEVGAGRGGCAPWVTLHWGFQEHRQDDQDKSETEGPLGSHDAGGQGGLRLLGRYDVDDEELALARLVQLF